ncbi:MAG: FAD:protein FMN transferase [Flavobacteriaceae bacterium]|nr:FAD:protein FMN transferase [Flavobacteriaceae bacterium]
MKSIKIIFFLSTILLFSVCKNQDLKKDFTLKGFVFGTTYKITYLNSDKNYQKSLDSLFNEINNSLSTYIPDSDISKINNGNESVLIDDYFKEVFTKSKKIFNETDGFFDPTVGNLVNAYGFGPNSEIKNLSDEDIKELMRYVGFNKVKLIENRVVKEYPEIYLDFNSIAKGYGIDIVARFFNEKGIKNYLIEIGGEIRAKGVKHDNKPWLIQIIDPLNIDNGFKTINLTNKSMATSGNYIKFRVDSLGNKYVHTINPKTGYAKESNLLSASVIAEADCADVDAYATAFMAMGLEKTLAFLEAKKELKVILIYHNKKGDLSEYTNL